MSKTGAGYVKLYRKVRDSEIWKTAAGRLIWTQLLVDSTHKTKVFFSETLEQEITIERGQCLIAIREYAEECLVSYKAARLVFSKMQKLRMVDLEVLGSGSNRLTKVTLLNFDKHQTGKAGAQVGAQVGAQTNTRIYASKLMSGAQAGARTGASAVEVRQEVQQEKDNKVIAGGRPQPVETDQVRKDRMQAAVWLKELPMYRDDPGLNAVDKKTGRVRIAQAMELWRSSAPCVDRYGELKKAHSWEFDHPERRKKHRLSFLGNWMRRANENGMKAAPQERYEPIPRRRPDVGAATVFVPAVPRLKPPEQTDEERADILKMISDSKKTLKKPVVADNEVAAKAAGVGE